MHERSSGDAYEATTEEDPRSCDHVRPAAASAPSARPGRKAVIYVTDANFLYPTLVAALQVERQIEESRTDVVLFVCDVPEEALEIAALTVAGHRIRLKKVDPKLFALPTGVAMLPSHVPIISLARLMIEKILDPVYDRVLYLDGDMLVTGDIRPLLAFDPSPGTIGAVRGSVWLTRRAKGGKPGPSAGYVNGLGLKVPDSYFNAGVLSLRRGDLRLFGAAAFRYFLEHSALCRFHDQSALNHVCDGRVAELWPGYNYHMPYQELLPPRSVQPAIVHFTGSIKPWIYRIGRFAPFAAVYDRFDAQNPIAATLRVQASAKTQALERRRLLRRAVGERLSVWHWLQNRRRLRRYMNEFSPEVAGKAVGAVATRGLLARRRRVAEQA